jgi:hypothetical protein
MLDSLFNYSGTYTIPSALVYNIAEDIEVSYSVKYCIGFDEYLFRVPLKYIEFKDEIKLFLYTFGVPEEPVVSNELLYSVCSRQN